MPILKIYRGLPGSGKTTLANKEGTIVLSPADMYSMRNGKYQWCREYSKKGHVWSNKILELTMEEGIDITIAEVLPKEKSMRHYFNMAKKYNYKVEVIDCKADIDTSYKRNVHNVPMEHIKGMSEVWEDWDDIKERL